MNTCNLGNLSAEVVLRILAYLPVKDIVRVACASKTLYALSLDFQLDNRVENIEKRALLYLKSNLPLPDLLAKRVKTLQIGRFRAHFTEGFLLGQIIRMENLRTLIVKEEYNRLPALTEEEVQALLAPRTAEGGELACPKLELVKVPFSFVSYQNGLGQTLLHTAVAHRNRQVVEGLLGQKLDVQVKDQEEKTPIDLALERGDPEILALFIRQGFQGEGNGINREIPPTSLLSLDTTKDGSTAQGDFHSFFDEIAENTELLRLQFSKELSDALVAYSSPEARGLRWAFFQRLTEALMRNRALLVLDLIGFRALKVEEAILLMQSLERVTVKLPSSLLESVDDSGQTLLHQAVKQRKKTMAQSLLAQGIAITRKDNTGCTAWDLAAALQDQEMMQLIEQAKIQRLSRAFGSKDWKTYFGDVGKEPPLPVNILEVLESPCPIWPRHKIQDTHHLILIPEKVNGKALTLNCLKKWARRPKGGGYATDWEYYEDEVQELCGEQPSKGCYWVLLTKDVLVSTLNLTYQEQLRRIRKKSKDSEAFRAAHYRAPDVLEVAVCALAHYVKTRKRLYSGLLDNRKRPRYTLCLNQVHFENETEEGEIYSVLFGFTKHRLHTNYHDFERAGHVGMGLFREL